MFVGGGVLDAPREGESPPLQITYTGVCRAASPLAAAAGSRPLPAKQTDKGATNKKPAGRACGPYRTKVKTQKRRNYMSDFITKLSELIDPEVMGDMVSARIPKKLRVAPFAKIDDTLQGVPGDTITVPAYTYIGDASDVAEGGEVAIEKMTTSTRKATIKKAMKGIGLTDEAVLSGYGNPVGEANTQLAQAIAAKVDNDCMDALQSASLIYDGSQAQISYNAIVDAVDLFEEEMGCSDKVLFIHPKQVTQLRKNPDFLSADKYTPGVSLTGEIGMIAGCRLVPSKKVPLAEGVYACPIVKLEADPEVDDEIPALTIYRKREVNIETERKPKTRTTEITADEFYVAVLSNEAKVVLAKFKA